MIRSAVVMGFSLPGLSRNSRYRKVSVSLRPIQYTGILLEAWVVSSGALLSGAVCRAAVGVGTGVVDPCPVRSAMHPDRNKAAVKAVTSIAERFRMRVP